MKQESSRFSGRSVKHHELAYYLALGVHDHPAWRSVGASLSGTMRSLAEHEPVVALFARSPEEDATLRAACLVFNTTLHQYLPFARGTHRPKYNRTSYTYPTLYLPVARRTRYDICRSCTQRDSFVPALVKQRKGVESAPYASLRRVLLPLLLLLLKETLVVSHH